MNRHTRAAVALAALLQTGLCSPPTNGSFGREFLVYFGTYTGRKAAGIYVSRFDAATGRLTAPELAAATPSPSFLALHPNRRFLYAVNETSVYPESGAGAITAFAIEGASGKLRLLNQQSSRGSSPCHLTVDRSGRRLLAVNYGSGSVVAYSLRPDGSLGELSAFIQHSGAGAMRGRQEGPHAHSVHISPDNRYALVADLGADGIFSYRFDPASGALAPAGQALTKVAPGSGPRQLDIHPTGRYVYAINELSSTITVFSYDAARGALTELQTVPTLPKGFTGANAAAAVQAHPNGRFLYGSNRGHDSIVVFAIDRRKGTLTYSGNTPTGGRTPRSFSIDPAGRFLIAANQGSGNAVVFRIDRKTGRLAPTGESVAVGEPVCVTFAPLPIAPARSDAAAFGVNPGPAIGRTQ